MTIATRFDHWTQARPPLGVHSRCSPNLVRIRDGARVRFGVTSLGCHGVRNVRGSATAPSVHSWGAAIDLSWVELGRERCESQLIPWLIAWSDELHVQAVHDYHGSRIWRAGRTPRESDACGLWWKAQRPDAHGMGQRWATWLHVETTMPGWGDDSPLHARGVD